MKDSAVPGDVIVDPRYWRAWLAIGAIGMVATVLTGAIFGIGPRDVLLLKDMALAPFTIVDYVVLGGGAVQGARSWLQARTK